MTGTLLDFMWPGALRCLCVGALVLGGSLRAGAQQPGDSDAFSRAMAFYNRNQLEAALPLFLEAAQEGPPDAERWSWVAETERRLDRVGDAVATAQRAVALSRCSSFAHTVLGAAFDPQHSSWPGVSHDSSWRYLHRAIACDPQDGNAWVLLWPESLRRRDTATVRRTFRALVQTGFLTPTTLEAARWVLRNALPHAVLLTAGDMDTYPLLAVQTTEGLRPDVAIVNEPMLNLPWYALRRSAEEGLPLPVPADSLEADDRRDVVPADLQESTVALWRRRAVTATLGRPLLFALTTGDQRESRELGRLRFVGAAWVVVPDGNSTRLDTAATRRAVAALDPQRWSGPSLSARDRSAVRRAAQAPAAVYPLFALGLYGDAVLHHGRRDAARDVLRRAEVFAAATHLDTARVSSVLGELRAALGSARQR